MKSKNRLETDQRIKEKLRTDPVYKARFRMNQRRRELKQKYNITLEDYIKMLAEQKGRCPICQTTEPGLKNKYFTVDHNHNTTTVPLSLKPKRLKLNGTP